MLDENRTSMKSVRLKKEYYWMELDNHGKLCSPRATGHFDGGYVYLNAPDIIDKEEAIKLLEKYYEAGGMGEYVLLEKYRKDNVG